MISESVNIAIIVSPFEYDLGERIESRKCGKVLAASQRNRPEQTEYRCYEHLPASEMTWERESRFGSHAVEVRTFAVKFETQVHRCTTFFVTVFKSR